MEFVARPRVTAQKSLLAAEAAAPNTAAEKVPPVRPGRRAGIAAHTSAVGPESVSFVSAIF